MSRLPLPLCFALTFAVSGCMNQPMYQPYPYGQPMYPQGYTQPGTLVIPPGDAPAYEPNGSTYEGTTPSNDDFSRDSGSGTKNDGPFYNENEGGVPLGKDPGTNNTNDTNDGLPEF